MCVHLIAGDINWKSVIHNYAHKHAMLEKATLAGSCVFELDSQSYLAIS